MPKTNANVGRGRGEAMELPRRKGYLTVSQQNHVDAGCDGVGVPTAPRAAGRGVNDV